jgi:sugar lactone lactonase YvrE
VALSALLALFLGAMPAMAITLPPPIAVTGPSVLIGDMQFGGAGGGWFGGQAPLGGTFVVGPNGDVIVGDGYGGNSASGVFLITPAGVQSVIANFANSNAAGIDKYGNVYIARDYGASIIKLPYNAAAGTYTGFTTLPTTNCQGGTLDTAACVFAPGTQAVINAGKTAGGGNPGFSSLLFDGQGNFFFATDTNPGTGAGGNANTIYECSAQCQAETDGAGTYPPVVVYADTLAMGVVAVDPWGNLFFSDGADNGANTGKVSYLEELPLSGGHYASAPTVITTYTTTAAYNAISGVSANNLNAVYFAVANDGVFAVPNSSSGPNAAGIYKVSSQGGKGMTVDSIGNLYVVGYSGTLSHDGVFVTLFNNFAFGASAVGTAATAVTATAIDNAGNCTTPPTLTFKDSESGVSTTEFATVAGTTCSTAVGTSNGAFTPALASTGASYSATITFTPTAVGARNAALVITDSTNSASGVTALTGVGNGATGNVDPGVSTAFSTGFTSPASVVADPAGDVFVADSGAGKVYEIAHGSTTLTPVGSGLTAPDALAFDANGNLFIADNGGPDVVEIPNTGTTGAFVAGTQLTVVSSTAPILGTALSSATGLAVGPNGRLYISDTANKRVVYWNPLTGQSGVTLANTANGVKAPVGLAVDSSGNLYVADSTLDQVLIFSAAGGIASVTPPNVTQAVGVAVDPSGSVLVADAVSGNIVRIPDLTGTLTTASAITIETVPSQASSLSMDSLGDIYVASASGKAAYAIQRTAAAINFGTVSDGVSNSGTVYLMSAGNSAATLGTPDVTEPTNTMFTLVPAASNGCASGTAGPPGSSCQFTATFAPPPATPNGPQTGVATINIATPAVTFNVNMSGTATTSSILSQTITGFAPPASIQVGQQITLSATGGASGNPVTFSIDASSACPTCATIAGSVLTAVSTGVIKVDANQAGGTANGKQYAAATQVQAPITVQYTVVASDVPALLMSQIVWSYQSGAFTDGQNPAGGSFAVTQNGLIYVGTTYNNKTDIVNASTGALVQQLAMNGGGVFTIDSKNNLYMGHLYSSAVYKIPFVSGAYVALSDLSSAPNCTGTDTAICTVGSIPSGGMKAIAFDASGNLYMVTVPASPGTSAIYECAASCQTGGTATLVYSDTTGAVSQIAFDPWGNMFFTDGVYASSGNFSGDEVNTSNLYELPYTAGTGFATTPTLLQTLTDATPANYDNQLDGVAVTPTGTVYYADQNDGTFAIPNTKTGGPDTAHQYVVSALGAKGMELDANGNEWVVVYHSGGDNIGEALLGDLTTPNAQYDGAPVNAAATVVDNALPCTTAATLAIASSNPEFVATAGTTCSMISAATFSTPVSASSYTATITFTATKPNSQTGTLTVTDTTNGGEGTATVTGFALTTPQALTFTAPTTITATYAPGLTIAVSVSNGGSNNPAVFTVDSSSSGTGTFSATTVTGKTSSATLTVTQAGSIVIDANELGGLAGGVYYDAAPQVQLTLTINKSPQAITFAQPTSPQAYTPGLTVNLSALGGGAATPVVFSVDASSTGAGTITTTTVTGNTSTATLTVTQAGTIVLDANQATDVDYLAAPQVQQVLVVNLAAQTITFTPVTVPFHYIASCSIITQCATISIQASGGATNNLIAISPDTKNTVSFTILSSSVSKTGVTTTTIALLPNQTLASPANLVLDGNQQGNANYAAATQATLTIPVLATLPLQSITWANPGTQVGATSLTLTGIASSGFPVTYTSGTSTVCTVSGAKVTFASVTSASPCTITATQPGDNLTFAAAVPLTQTLDVNPAGQNPNMSINLSLSSLIIQPGTVGLTQVTLTSVNNFAVSSIAFSCSGLPTGYTCSFNPNPTTAFAQNTSTGMPLGTTVTTTLTITPPSTAAVVRQDFRPLFPATLAVALCFLGFKKRNRLYMLVLLVVLFAGLGFVSGCGGTSSSSTPPPVTSTATITATPAAGLAGASGSIQSSATLSVTLE